MRNLLEKSQAPNGGGHAPEDQEQTSGYKKGGPKGALPTDKDSEKRESHQEQNNRYETRTGNARLRQIRESSQRMTSFVRPKNSGREVPPKVHKERLVHLKPLLSISPTVMGFIAAFTITLGATALFSGLYIVVMLLSIPAMLRYARSSWLVTSLESLALLRYPTALLLLNTALSTDALPSPLWLVQGAFLATAILCALNDGLTVSRYLAGGRS
ncbi:MAG: hypothetical protein K9H25_17175 [Rhodospirillum sp.]|nr:hypothetical protein [Rhodospirillum sp.]MCF8501784.1 hypothetical protein [Rhodospirillum sp.]